MEKLQPGVHKPPAVVIIARHGARIDAVDKEWHLTSPTPYDPPLTYGGWLQGRALGARIASLLKAREISMHNDIPSASSSSTTITSLTTEAVSGDTHQRAPRKVRKHKLIIHSSPFLRCVQTSVAISAGISQYYRSENEHSIIPTPSSSTSASENASPLASPPRSTTPTSADQWTRHTGKDKINGQGKRAKGAPKTRLRVDGFLGEWLSADYFDQITPPPGSLMMVAGAKSELSKRGETLHRAHNVGSNSFSGHFPGGWKSNHSPTSPLSPDAANENGSFGMSTLADALPSEGRSGDDGFNYNRSIKPMTIRDVLSRTPSHSHEDFSEGYIPPVPSYAVSPSDSIPQGYVAHARDACVDVDYHWDSMKEPQNWGDGGDYGEEWSAMHKRFRNGLLNLLDWYSREQPRKHHNHRHHHNHHHHSHGEEDDTDTVVVLVTHGPGCNALIGALTNQPVLIDMPMASLTMAVRKDLLKPKDPTHQSPDTVNNGRTEQRILPSATSLHDIYDVSLIASTEHLLATSNPLSIPQLPTPTVERPRSISIYRHRGDSSPVQLTNSNGINLSQSASRKHGLQRAATINSSPHHHSTRNGSGLWGSASNIQFRDNSSAEVEQNFNRRYERPKLAPLETKTTNDETNDDAKLQAVAAADAKAASSSSSQFASPNQPHERLQEQQPKAQLGLWSSNAAVAQVREREPTVRRRWTITEKQ